MRRAVPGILAVMLAIGCASKKPIPGIEQLNQPSSISRALEKQPAFDGRVQVIAFNIEQGRFWEDAAKYIAEKQAQVPATIVLLSEADRGHSRSGDVFVAEKMAEALGMDMVYATEFIEYNDKTKDSPGETGNAILSAFPLSEISVIRQLDVYSWTRWGWLQGQPRKGERVAIGATALLPDGRRLRVYVAHLENYGTGRGRARQMRQILEDAEKYKMPAVIGGDLNELPGGILFKEAAEDGFENAFVQNRQPTGACIAVSGKLVCSVKIDWQLARGLNGVEAIVDYPLNSQAGAISDHAPVRALYSLP
jgi:endonuclease/exonuclease/phosphatase family metal-dependent hydrolase